MAGRYVLGHAFFTDMSRIDAIEILLAAVRDGALDGCDAVEKQLLVSLAQAAGGSDDLLALLQHRPDLH